MAKELPFAAMEALRNGRKIEAIKIVRQEWGTDLKAAKEAVDGYLASYPELASQLHEAGEGAKRVLLWLLVLAGAGVLLFIFLRRS